MSKEWDDADAECRSRLGPGFCAVSDDDGHPFRNPHIHCARAIIGKNGETKFTIRMLDKLPKVDPKKVIKK